MERTEKPEMYVVKRDGTRQAVIPEKITERNRKLCEMAPRLCIDLETLTTKVCSGLCDEIRTSDIDRLAAETAAYMSASNPEYGMLAARIEISNLQKLTNPSFYATARLLLERVDPKTAKPAPAISAEFFRAIETHAELLDATLVEERDFILDYFGFKTLERSYLFRVDGRVVERPQHMWMRVALALNVDDIDAAIETYHLLSQGYYTHATPTLCNAGTPRPQMSSCFLVDMSEDSIEGIYATLRDCALISKHAGGIGLSVHRIRASGSFISGTGGVSSGLIPMLRVYNETARYVDQGGGKRKGAMAVYLEPWHADVFDFLDLRKNHGKEELRARDIFIALWIPDLFMERVEANAAWSLFCPHEAPGLHEVWGKDFEELYTRYERENRARRTVSARNLWFAILDSQIETGAPFMLYKDNANRKSNQRNLGTIACANLCTEVIEYANPEEIAVCNLASISLPKFVDEKTGSFDHEGLVRVVKRVTRNLNQIIDLNHYPLKKAKRSNLRHRPIGIGVQGLADVFLLLRLTWESEAAAKLNREIFETIYYAALSASNELARSEGPYESFEGSPASNGLLQFDLWNARPSSRWDWDKLVGIWV